MARAADCVICRHCRQKFRAVTGPHLRRWHGYRDEHPVLAYKRRFHLVSATCTDVRSRLRAATTNHYDDSGRQWTPAVVLSQIQRMHRAGRKIRKRSIPTELYAAACRLYGSLEAAVLKSGLDYEQASGVHRWNQKKVAVWIRKLADEGVVLHAANIRRRYGPLYRAARMHFSGSWSKALSAAGYDPAEHKQPRGRWNRFKARQWVQRRIDAKRSILRRDAPADLRKFVRHWFGQRWTDFIESFGIRYPGTKPQHNYWTKQKVLSEIHRLRATRCPMGHKAAESAVQGLVAQAKKFFGSWSAAVRAAGS